MKLDVGVLVDNKFEVREQKGRGANGATFVANQLGLDREIVLKTVFNTDANSRQRFLREAYALSLITHPNIVSFYGYGTWEQQPYLAMELVRGDSLEQVLSQQKSLSLESLISILRQIAAGLACLHANGIVHRDLTPLNVVVSGAADGEPKVKIIDLGLAKLLGEEHHRNANQLTEAGQTVGSVMYMSPEQCRGIEATGSSDVYSFACIMYRMFAGSPPFAGESAITLMLHHTESEFPKLPQPREQRLAAVMKKFDTLIQSCVAKDPADRASIDEVIRQLDALAEFSQASRSAALQIPVDSTDSPQSAPPTVLSLTKSSMKSKRIKLAAATILVLGTAACAAVYVNRREDVSKHIAALNATANVQLSGGRFNEAFQTIAEAVDEAQRNGLTDAAKESLSKAINLVPSQKFPLSTRLVALAEQYYAHSATNDNMQIPIVVSLVATGALNNDSALQQKWFAIAVQNPELRQPQFAMQVASLMRNAPPTATQDTLADLSILFFNSMRVLVQSTNSPDLPLSLLLTSMREPFDAATGPGKLLPDRRREIIASIQACLDAVKQRAQHPSEKFLMHQFQGELDAAAGDFNSASKEFAQAIAVESPASRETAEAVRVRLELSQNLARAGKPEEALSVTRDAISVSKDLSDKRARLVAVRILASQLADQNIMAPGTYRAAYDAFAAAVAYDARFARTRADQVERNETLQITDSAAQVYYRVLLAQHKDAEARLLAQRIVELHQGRALPVPVLGK